MRRWIFLDEKCNFSEIYIYFCKIPFKLQDLRSRLTELMAQNQHFLAAERADRQERLMNQSLREEQDRAYEESLRADEAKERRRRDLEDAKRLEEEAER